MAQNIHRGTNLHTQVNDSICICAVYIYWGSNFAPQKKRLSFLISFQNNGKFFEIKKPNLYNENVDIP